MVRYSNIQNSFRTVDTITPPRLGQLTGRPVSLSVVVSVETGETFGATLVEIKGGQTINSGAVSESEQKRLVDSFPARSQ